MGTSFYGHKKTALEAAFLINNKKDKDKYH